MARCSNAPSSLLPPSIWEIETPIGPYAEIAGRHTVRWASDLGLITSTAAESRLSQAGIGDFAARVYPAADLESSCLAADWITWLDCLDDQNDDNPEGLDPNQYENALAKVISVVSGGDAPTAAGPLGTALSDLMARSRALSVPWVGRRLAHNVADYLWANIEQAARKAVGVPPSLAEYPQTRRRAGGILATFDLIEILQPLGLPVSLFYAPEYQELVLAAADVVCWINDLLTLEKEVSSNDIYNLVLVIDAEQQSGLHEARQRARDLSEQRIADFISAEERLLTRVGNRCPTDPHTLTSGLRAWMRGHVDWGLNTTRYRTIGGSDYLENLLP